MITFPEVSSSLHLELFWHLCQFFSQIIREVTQSPEKKHKKSKLHLTSFSESIDLHNCNAFLATLLRILRQNANILKVLADFFAKFRKKKISLRNPKKIVLQNFSLFKKDFPEFFAGLGILKKIFGLKWKKKPLRSRKKILR